MRLKNKRTPRWSGRLLMGGAVLSAAALLLTAAPGAAIAAPTAAVPAAQTASVAQTAAVAQAPNAVGLPAVTPGEVKAAEALLSPSCGCPPNAPEVEYALKQLGVKSLSLKLLIKRLGKEVGTDAFVGLVLSLTKKAARVKKRVPYPDYRAKSATLYEKTPYRVYEIFGTSLGPGFYHWTWKYGITRQLIPSQRPQPQVPACTKYFGARNLTNRSCTWDWRFIGVGWLQARTIEATLTLVYAIENGGQCPPGMPICV